MKNILFVVLGSGCFVLGIIGVFLPVLPTTPFLLAAFVCFAKGSPKLHGRFVETKLYKNHLESFVEKRGMRLKTKISLITSITLIMGLGFFVMARKGLLLYCIILAVVWICHILYFVFKVKTVK